jgi:hypothetical protein
MTWISRAFALALFPTTLVAGCGDKKGDSASIDTLAAIDTAQTAEAAGDTGTAPAAASTQSPDQSSQPVTVADIDRWQKGMAGEMKAVQTIGDKMKAAKTTEEKLTIMGETHEQSTAAAGARAAGLDEERYKFVRDHLSNAASRLAPLELGIDTTQIPQSRREQERADRDAYFKQMAWAVPPDVVEALEPRAKELSNQNLELAGARLKASGMAR